MAFLKQGMLVSVAKLGEKLLSFVIIIIAARLLGSEGVGEFFFYFSVASLFIPLMDVGFVQLLLQRWGSMAKPDRQEMMTHFFVLKLLFGLIALLFSTMMVLLIRGSQVDISAQLAAFAAIYFDQMGSLIRAPDYARCHVRYEVCSVLIGRLVTFSCMLVMGPLLTHGDQLCYLYALGNFTSLLISLPALYGYTPANLFCLKLSMMKELLKAGWPFSVSGLFVMSSMYIDSVILGYFSLSDVGLYNAAYRLIIVAGLLSGGAVHAIYPRLVNWYNSRNYKELNQSYQALMNAFFFLFGSITLGSLILGPRLLLALYGKEFAQASLVLQLLSPTIVVLAYTNLLGQTLEAIGMQRKAMHICMYSSLFNLVTNLLFIPLYGMIGAAVTTLITECIALFLLCQQLLKHTQIDIKLSRFRHGLLFLSIIALVFSLLNLLPIWQAFLASVAFFLLLLLPWRTFWLGQFHIGHIGR